MPDLNTVSNNNNTKKRTRRKRKKRKKKKAVVQQGNVPVKKEQTQNIDEDVEIEYVGSNILDNLDEDSEAFKEFSSIFSHFGTPESMFSEKQDDEDDEEKAADEDEDKKDDEDEDEDTSNDKKKLTKKERKQLKREQIAVLKQIVERPDVVEVHDVNAADPTLLIHLKSYRNTVPVPIHWSQRRKYLQGKRGIEKAPFELPDFIKQTGISTIRQAILEKEEQMAAKQRQRERVAPKMGKIEIDYQVLYDAFFKYQTKPKLSSHGDLYYEGKEYEVNLKERKPGILSKELKECLGMREGGGVVEPVPWLINMQRYGPPPSYPSLLLPGLNSPIPPNAQYGYHQGGWGKPPVDENGRPLYGDVFGVEAIAPLPEVTAPVQKQQWGKLMEEADLSDSDDEESEGEEAYDALEEQEATDETGTASVTGVETPTTIQLRKRAENKELYQVLEQQESSVGNNMYGSSFTYKIPKKTGGERVELFKSQKGEKVDITLNPADLEDGEGLSEQFLRKKYEEQKESEKLANAKEDFSDLVAEQNRLRKRKTSGKSDQPKKRKKKEFKF